MTARIFIGNDHRLRLERVLDVTGEPVTGASGAVTLMTEAGDDGEEVEGQDWPEALAEIEPGLYDAPLEDTLELVPDREYLAVVELTGPLGDVAHLELPVVAAVRRG